MHGLAQRFAAIVCIAARHVGQALQRVFQVRFGGVQRGAAGICDGIAAAAFLAGNFGDQACIGQHVEHRIDHARRRRIKAGGQILDGLDQVITVARLFLEQVEDEDLQRLRAETAAARTRAIPAITEFIGKALRKGGPATATAGPAAAEVLGNLLVEAIAIEVETEVHGGDSRWGC